MITRRGFLYSLIIGPCVTAFQPDPPLTAIDKLYGIDWGLNDATVGTWMGITRSTIPQFTSSWVYPPGGTAINKELIALIRKMMDKAMEDNHQIIVRSIYDNKQV